MTESGAPPSFERLAALRALGKTALSPAALSAVSGFSLLMTLYAASSGLEESVKSWRSAVHATADLSTFSAKDVLLHGSPFYKLLLLSGSVSAVVVLLYGMFATRFLFRFARPPRRPAPGALQVILSYLMVGAVSSLSIIIAGFIASGWFHAPADRFLQLPAVTGKLVVYGGIPILIAAAAITHFLARLHFFARHRMTRRDSDAELRDGP